MSSTNKNQAPDKMPSSPNRSIRYSSPNQDAHSSPNLIDSSLPNQRSASPASPNHKADRHPSRTSGTKSPNHIKGRSPSPNHKKESATNGNRKTPKIEISPKDREPSPKPSNTSSRKRSLTPSSRIGHQEDQPPAPLDQLRAATDTAYYDSYNNLFSHDVMLKDKRRLQFFREFFTAGHGALVKDKVVMDLGCGTGILSLYAARAGAKHVYAVEASEVAALAKHVIVYNGYSERVTVVNKPVEQCSDRDFPHGLPDIIVSEWMGFYLLHESMLQSVLFARNNFLKNGGLIYPNSAVLYASPVDRSKNLADNFDLYNSLDGFDYSQLRTLLWEERLKSPECECVQPEEVLSFAHTVLDIDIMTVKPAALKSIFKTMKFDLTCSGVVHGICMWFTTSFNSEQFSSVLDTSPYRPATHWKQTTVYLPVHTEMQEGGTLVADIELTQCEENYRWYNITVTQKAPAGSVSAAGSFVSTRQSKQALPRKESKVSTAGSTLNNPLSDDGEEDDDVIANNDVISALISSLSEQYNQDPSTLARVIAEGAAPEDLQYSDDD